MAMNEKDIEYCHGKSFEFGELALKMLYCYGAMRYPDQWGDYPPGPDDLNYFADLYVKAHKAESCQNPEPKAIPDVINHEAYVSAFLSILDRTTIPCVNPVTIREKCIFEKMIDASSIMALAYDHIGFQGQYFPDEDLGGGITFRALWPNLSKVAMNRGQILRDQCFRVMGYWEGTQAEKRISDAERTGKSTATKRQRRKMKENIYLRAVKQLLKDGRFDVSLLIAMPITKIVNLINDEGQQDFERHEINPPEIDTAKSILAGLEMDSKIKNAILKRG
jgi:hypothetical protein